ncbi:putative benzoate carboxyl methyltransferase-like [Capsicum annuum]|nr:putative benzoate carboxyl methyltransferase-like [Capsicum annuum]
MQRLSQTFLFATKSMDLFGVERCPTISQMYLLGILDNPQLHHFFREQNRLANELARLPSTTSTTTLFWTPPQSLSDILYADMNGVLLVRRVNTLPVHPRNGQQQDMEAYESRECSYASNSTLQREVIQQAKPDLEDAIKKMFNNTGEFPKCLNMAYLGCSVGFIVYERSVNEKMGSKMVEEKETIKWKVYSQIRKFILSPTLVEEENLKVFIIKNTYSTWQGLIEQAELDSFDYPFYAPYKDEVETIVQTEGSFDPDTIKLFQMNWDERDNDDDVCFDAYSSGKHVARTMRAVLEQMLVSHFQLANSVVDYLFQRYAYHLACHFLVQKGALFGEMVYMFSKNAADMHFQKHHTI